MASHWEAPCSAHPSSPPSTEPAGHSSPPSINSFAIPFIESRQADVLEKILRHCGLWADPPPSRAPPAPPVDPDATRRIEPDGEFEDYRRRETDEQPAFDW